MKSYILLMGCAVSLAGCMGAGSQDPAPIGQSPSASGAGQVWGKPNQARNAALGAAAGAVLGQVWGRDSEATATGAIVGGVIGSQLNTVQ